LNFPQFPHFFNLSKVDRFFPLEEVLDVDGLKVAFGLTLPYETVETFLWDLIFEASLYSSWRLNKRNITNSCLKLW